MSREDVVFFGSWANFDGMWSNFHGYWGAPPPPAIDVRWAAYEEVHYEGYAWVIFEEGGELYEVHGSHCSCRGLEGQWSPERTSWEFVAKELKTALSNRHPDYSPEALIRLTLLVSAHVPFLDAVEGGAA